MISPGHTVVDYARAAGACRQAASRMFAKQLEFSGNDLVNAAKLCEREVLVQTLLAAVRAYGGKTMPVCCDGFLAIDLAAIAVEEASR